MTVTWTVGLDGSDGSCSALRWANMTAALRGERVQPVAVWHLPLPLWVLAGRRVADVDRLGIEAEVSVYATRAVAALENRDAVEDPVVVEGHPASTLCEMAGPDTPLVVGRRGVGELRHRLLGSVSQYLATHAAGPVVVVPDEWEDYPLQRIVVGFDGSDEAIAALRWAISMVPDDGEIEMLVAVDVIPWLQPESVIDRHPEAVTAARERISAAADTVDPDHRASRHFVMHGPRHALAEALVDADLVVVGPRGLGSLARALLGSVTTWLLHESPCPVAIIPT